MPLPLLLPIAAGALTGAGTIGSLFSKRKSAVPDIGGELDKIAGLFAQLRAQNTTNINREAAQGRSALASGQASRGILRSPVSAIGANALEDSRLNAIATSDAELSGQEAQVRSSLLRSLLGLNAEETQAKNAINASRWGGITGLGSNLLLAQLMRGGGAA